MIFFFCLSEKDWYADTESDDKESVQLFLHKNLGIIGVLGKSSVRVCVCLCVYEEGG